MVILQQKYNISTLFDAQAEAGVIATLIYHPEFILHTDYLRPKYFYDTVNGSIYWAIEQLYKSGVDTIDALNITNMLNSNKSVKKVIDNNNLGNMQEFIDMCQYAARHTINEYKLLVNNVVTLSFKRDLNKVATEIQSSCFNSDADLSKLNKIVNDKISKLTEQYITTGEISMFGDKVEDLWREVVSRRTEDGVYGIPSKFSSLNNYFTYEPGELVLLSARMKRGKSAFFLNEAMHKLMSGVPTLYVDTEMQDRLFYERILANLTGIEIKRIKTGRYDENDGKKISAANEWMKKQPFVHIYMPEVSDEEVYATCKILKYKMNLQFVVYDYIKSNESSSSEQYNILGAKTDFLKNRIAGELNLAVLAGAQLNRQDEISDSDKIARYISTNIKWREKTIEEVRHDGLKCGNYCARVELNRNGEQMAEDEYIDMMFDGARMRIEEAEKHVKEETPFGNG